MYQILCLVIVNVTKYVPQNVNFVAIRCVLSSSKYTKTRFWPWFRPYPAGGAYDAPQSAEEGDTLCRRWTRRGSSHLNVTKIGRRRKLERRC